MARGFIRQKPLFTEWATASGAVPLRARFPAATKRSITLGWYSDPDSKREHDCSIRISQSFGYPIRNLGKRTAEVAWNMASAAYYKAGARPWKLAGVRPGVCYIGLVFKNDDKSPDGSAACCAAQMFLDSGDGVVFKGRVGPWYTGKRGRYHLSASAAEELLGKAIADYKLKRGVPPEEIFIHGRTRFDDEEWKGFAKQPAKARK